MLIYGDDRSWYGAEFSYAIEYIPVFFLRFSQWPGGYRPCIDLARRDAVSTLRRFLGQRGVIIAGRWAEWKYSAMEDAILDGMSAARRVAGSE